MASFYHRMVLSMQWPQGMRTEWIFDLAIWLVLYKDSIQNPSVLFSEIYILSDCWPGLLLVQEFINLSVGRCSQPASAILKTVIQLALVLSSLLGLRCWKKSASIDTKIGAWVLRRSQIFRLEVSQFFMTNSKCDLGDEIYKNSNSIWHLKC